MFDRYYSDEALFEMAFRSGQDHRREGAEAQPLRYVIGAGANFIGDRSEAFFRQLAECYQAGYDGRTPVQLQ